MLPSLALCSAAARTVETATGTRPWAARPARGLPSLYGAGPRDVLALVGAVDGEPPSVLVVGHNPTVSHLAHDLLADGPPTGAPRTRGLPTCSLAVVDLDVGSWAEVADGCGTLVGWCRPPY